MNSTLKASSLKELPLFLTMEPLSAFTKDGTEDPHWQWFVKTDAAREEAVAEILEEELKVAHGNGKPWRALVAGHEGCGKSTELERLYRALAQDTDYAVRFASVKESLPVVGATAHQLALFCMRLVIDEALARDSVRQQLEGRNKGLIDRISGWFDRNTYETVIRDTSTTTASAGGSVKLLRDLFLKYESVFVRGTEQKQTITRFIEDRFDLLADHLATLIDLLHAAMYPRRLLLIVDDIDKMSGVDDGLRVFRDGRPLLQTLPCSVIYTLPMRLWYEDREYAKGYDQTLLLPMIPVKVAPEGGSSRTPEERQRKRDAGMKCLREIVHERVEERLINPAALDAAIEMSGGVLRDLFRLLLGARTHSTRDGRDQIAFADVVREFTRLRDRHYRNALAPSMAAADRALGVTTESITRVLGSGADWPRRRLDPGPTERLLLQRLCILEYNGEVWYDLHPAVRDLLRVYAEEATLQAAQQLKAQRTDEG